MNLSTSKVILVEISVKSEKALGPSLTPMSHKLQSHAYIDPTSEFLNLKNFSGRNFRQIGKNWVNFDHKKLKLVRESINVTKSGIVTSRGMLFSVLLVPPWKVVKCSHKSQNCFYCVIKACYWVPMT